MLISLNPGKGESSTGAPLPPVIRRRAEMAEDDRPRAHLFRAKAAGLPGARRSRRFTVQHSKARLNIREPRVLRALKRRERRAPFSAAALSKSTGVKSRWFGRRSLGALWFAIALSATAATISEDFSTDPAPRGWRIFGDASLYHWNATNRNLEVTWDSSHTNSYFYVPLGTVLTKSDDFSFSFDLRLSDLRVGSTPGKSNEFEIAIGLLNYRSGTNTKAFRGAGVSPSYGVRNILEFDYFPDAGLGDTFATTVISSNNMFAYAFDYLTLSVGDAFRIAMNYTGSNQLLRTVATINGAPFNALADVLLADFPDF